MNAIEEIRLENVGKAFDEVPILNDVNVVFRKRRIALIVGPSGSGKSTLIDMITGINLPDEGVVLVNGISMKDLEIMSWRRQGLATLHKKFSFTTTLSKITYSWDDKIFLMKRSISFCTKLDLRPSCKMDTLGLINKLVKEVPIYLVGHGMWVVREKCRLFQCRSF